MSYSPWDRKESDTIDREDDDDNPQKVQFIFKVESNQ